MSEDLMLEAKEALVKGDLDKSAEIFGKVLEQNPDDLIALFSRAMAYFKLKKHDQAMADLDLYIQKNQINEKVYCSRANVWLAKGNTDEALKDVNYSLELNPQYPNAYFTRAAIFQELGEEDQASEDHGTAIKLQRQIAKAFYESQGFTYDDQIGAG